MENNSVKSRNEEMLRKSRSADHQGSIERSRNGKSGVGNDDVKNTKKEEGNANKSRSVDHQGSNEGHGKGKSGVGDGDVKITKKRKRSNIVGLSSVEQKVMKSRKSVDDGVASVSAKSDGPGLGQDLDRSNGLTEFLFSLDGSGNAIPRKPRGSFGSKSHVAKQLGPSGSVDQTNQVKTAKLNSDQNYCNPGVPSIPQHAKKRRGRLFIDEANFTDEGNVGDASFRKGKSHGKKMKCLPVDNLEFVRRALSAVEYVESSSEFSSDIGDVVDALMLLSSQPDAQCTGPYLHEVCSSDPADRLDNVADRLQMQGSDKGDVIFDCKIDPEKLMWSIGGDGLLKLNPALIPYREFSTQLSLPVCPLLDFPFGSCTARLSRLLLLLQYGKIVITWPKVYLEMLFVDNEVGLRFFCLEGCLKQAVAFVFFVLTLFCDTNKLGEYAELKIPVSSIRFKLSCVQDFRKQYVFTFYSFSKLEHSNWLYLDSVFQKHCVISKKLPLPECTLENIKALEVGSNLHMNHLSWESSQPVYQGSRRKNFKDFIPIGHIKSGKENGRQAPNCDVKHGMLPFALSFSAAPHFFRSLHLKLLMKSAIACVRLGKCTFACSMKLQENTCNSTTSNRAAAKHCYKIFRQVLPESTTETSLSDERQYGYISCTKAQLEIHSSFTASLECFRVISSQHKSFETSNTRNSSTSPLGDICSIWHGKRPRKPRTKVRYVMPSGGLESSSRLKPLNQVSQSFKRNRRPSKKKTFGVTKGFQRNLELLACDSNVLITLGDRCWREFGARVTLELADQNEWRLAVKFSGSTRYSHKVLHVFQPGSTNRYTHAMMWKGGKDWALEFPDRGQWILFKEMHEECYNRNIRAASVKNIPIPGVHLVEECEANTEKLPFTRSPRYFRQIEDDIDMAMNPSKILYDMDSEDEQWISSNEDAFQTPETCHVAITDDLFEKTMDTLEKVAYAQRRDHFTVAELEKLMVGVVPSEVINAIYQHWQQKRKKTGCPLIRHLQPPSWERYQQKLKEWNQLMTKANTAAARGGNVKKAPPVEKPAMFAFCLKPRGLELPNKDSKHRSQKKIHVTHALIGDQDGGHTFGRRSNSFAFRDEKATYPDYSPENSDTPPSTRIYSPSDICSHEHISLNNGTPDYDNHPKLYKNKSKKIGALLPRSNLHALPSYNHRTPGQRNGVQRRDIELPDRPVQMHYQSKGPENMQFGVRDLDELGVLEASSAAKRASNFARFKREKAQRLLYRADLAKNRAASAIMTADALKASYCLNEDKNASSSE